MQRREILHPDSLRELKAHVSRLEQQVYNTVRRMAAFRCELDDQRDLRGGCLAENHPGRGTEFDLYLGTWDAATTSWTYDTNTIVLAIDWRYGVPYPVAGATGLFQRRASNTHGEIWEVVALDCESPGPCGGD